MKELVQGDPLWEDGSYAAQDSGWYDYQVYALQSMLMPEMGEEHNKLLLTKPYSSGCSCFRGSDRKASRNARSPA